MKPFVCFMGLDGSGKSTGIEYARKTLAEKGVNVRVVRAAYVVKVMSFFIKLGKKILMRGNSDAFSGNYREYLENMRKNLYGLETDEGKLEVISGRLDASFQWSGDGVYILDEAEANGFALEYSIPEAASNLWFDGWVMMKDANEHAATAFVNFLSMPRNVIRNMYYIGYTSCIAGEEVFEYVCDTYSDEEGTVVYDLSYFFGEGHTFLTSDSQTRRQLFAQYPTAEIIDRLVVMGYFDTKTNERANRMWNNIK